MRTRRAQSLVLLALTMLLVTLMVLMTISIGVTAARRADLNDAADAAAYSSAVATARSFNTASVLNRAIVAHYVTMAGVQAQLSYVSSGHNYFDLAAFQFRMMDMHGPYPITSSAAFNGLQDVSVPGCSQRTTEARDASYEMWHVTLAWDAAGGPPDEVDGYCVNGVCSMHRNWIPESLGSLELKATDELREIHHAIVDLASIERDSFVDIHNKIDSGAYAQSVAAAGGISGVQVDGRKAARSEIEGATHSTPNAASSTYQSSFQRAFADAVLGSRHEEPLELPDAPENLAPLVNTFKAQTDAAFAAYPGQPFKVVFNPGDNSSDFAHQGTDNNLMLERPLVTDPKTVAQVDPTNMVLGYMTYLYSRNQGGQVITSYKDACVGGVRTITSNPANDKDKVTTDSQIPGITYQALPMGDLVRTAGNDGEHKAYESDYLDGVHWQLIGGGCHGAHQHYGWNDVSIHAVDLDLLPSQMLGFELPDPDMSQDGAHGIWGQPVLPVVLTRRINPAQDPWNLNFNFQFDKTENGTRFNMRKPVDETHGVSQGVAYYHRRHHLGEPANMLNPFWRATLVPMEIDERKGKVKPRGGAWVDFDPTKPSQAAGSRMDQIIVNDLTGYNQAKDARNAYNILDNPNNGIDGMRKVPDPELP